MKIYTKTGDLGFTSLLGGERVPKNHPRLMVVGTLDELNSYLGWVGDDLSTIESLKKYGDYLREIQNYLFNIGAILAAEDSQSISVNPPDQKDIEQLEKWLDKMDQSLPILKNFILPGGHSMVSKCQVSRAICRRAERDIFALSLNFKIPIEIISYINRLSDFLFVLARFIGHQLNVNEIKWKPEKQ
jgi:cob(I)alamin adenosyltransferase